MIINENCFLYINIGIALLYIVFIILGYCKGLIYEIISLLYTALSLFIAWFVAPVFANMYPIIKPEYINDENNILTKLVNLDSIINAFLYFVIVFVVLKIIYIVLSLFLKAFNKIPVLGTVNKIFGGLFGIVNATIVTLILSMALSMPIFKNGKDVREKTLFKLVDTYSNIAVDYLVDNFDIQQYSLDADNFDINEARNELKNWLSNNNG